MSGAPRFHPNIIHFLIIFRGKKRLFTVQKRKSLDTAAKFSYNVSDESMYSYINRERINECEKGK